MMESRELHLRLARFGQEHLLAFWDELSPEQREQLVGDIESIDFNLVAQLYGKRNDRREVETVIPRVQPAPILRLGVGTDRHPAEKAIQAGRDALRNGRVGVLLVAGGQGTRLKFPFPKGMYPIGPVSKCPLFQIHVEKVLATARRYGAAVPLYLMTSPATHEATVAYFRAHDRFGLSEADFQVFCQGTMPAVDIGSGKVLLAQKHRVALSPDGHGGMLAALVRSGLLEQMRQRGVRHLFYFQVDNPLVHVCLPEFLGYHLLCGSEFSSQVVAKQTPFDRVGNMVQVDGRLRVIEYSDLPDELATAHDADGSLKIAFGSIAVHVIDVEFLIRMSDRADALPFHIARKRQPWIDGQGRRIVPKKEDEENAIKFERFIFDLIPLAENAIAVEVDAQEHFAPLKNAPDENDTDNPETVVRQLAALHRSWLQRVGVSVADDVPVEISPLFALDAEELAGRIARGRPISTPTYFR